jgi:serine/threonine protein kinase
MQWQVTAFVSVAHLRCAPLLPSTESTSESLSEPSATEIMSPVPKPDSSDTSTKSDDLVGTILHERYQILRLLNEGGMAKIYLAKHTVLGREVAIKVLKGGCADDADVVQRFINEGRAAGTLGHPNIVECTDIGTTPDGKPYLVLELLVGHSLADEIIRTGPLAIGRAAKIAARIADALATAHVSGIVHRDLKSDNVFLSRKRGVVDWVKVLDFGVSKFHYDSVGTQKGSMLGTPDFMAPEQVVDAGAVDLRADIYALGVILYEMLAGRRPFQGIAFPMVLYAIAHEPPPSLESFRKDIPPPLLELVAKAMSKRPEDRQSSMFELVTGLEPFADRISTDASMDDLVASSSVRLSVVPFLEAISAAADESRRSSSGGAVPTSATLRNPNEKKNSWSMATILGAVAIASIIGLGAVNLLWERAPEPAAGAGTSSPASLRDMAIVDFAVTPADASVEVDGRPVEVANGNVKIKGIVGTVHHVRAFVGTHESRAEVVISLDGAIPSHIEVVVPKSGPAASLSASAVAPAVTVPVKR